MLSAATLDKTHHHPFLQTTPAASVPTHRASSHNWNACRRATWSLWRQPASRRWGQLRVRPMPWLTNGSGNVVLAAMVHRASPQLQHTQSQWSLTSLSHVTNSCLTVTELAHGRCNSTFGMLFILLILIAIIITKFQNYWRLNVKCVALGHRL